MSIVETDNVPGPQGATRLIVDQNEPLVWGGARETDARTALTRGVKEYLETLSIVGLDGREAHFKKCLETWAEPEQSTEYPTAIAYAPDQGTYEGDSFSTQTVTAKTDAAPVTLRLICELLQQVTVEAWTTDPDERMLLAAMLEDAFSPVEWMSGFRLSLPHYFNARASFLPISVMYQDSGEDAQRRIRKVIVTLEASIPVLRFVGPTPKLKPKFKFTLSGG